MATTTLNDNSVELQEEITEVLLPDSAKAEAGDLRKEYADAMNKAPFNDAARMESIKNTPLNKTIFEDYDFQAEEEPNRKTLLRAAMDASMEIATLDNEIINATDKYARLIASTIGRMNAVKERIQRNKERAADIEFAQNAYTGLKNVLQITEDDVTGNFGYYNRTFMASPQTIRQVLFSVEKVTGNGYSGNSYVLDDDNNFIESYDDRSLLANISDDSALTVYEYSRLCSRKGRAYYIESSQPENGMTAPYEVNYDDKDAVCTLTIHTEGGTPVNMLAVDKMSDDLQILSLQTSSDGVRYSSVITNTVDLGSDMYHAENYIPGSNIVCFPQAAHIKLTLSSGSVNASENLAIEKVDISDGIPVKSKMLLQDVVRKTISIGGIRLYSGSFSSSVMHTGNIAPKNGCKRIAVFCNEYIPETDEEKNDKKEDPLILKLYVNGAMHVVKPINSNEDGTKLITSAESGYGDNNVLHISEPIKTAQLEIEFNPQKSGLTPFVGNLKVIVG